jgi:hypothetical protein
VSSEKIGEAPTVMALYRKVIGATLLPALKGEAGHLRRAKRRSAANSQRQLEVFADFFLFTALCLFAEKELRDQ